MRKFISLFVILIIAVFSSIATYGSVIKPTTPFDGTITSTNQYAELRNPLPGTVAVQVDDVWDDTVYIFQPKTDNPQQGTMYVYDADEITMESKQEISYDAYLTHIHNEGVWHKSRVLTPDGSTDPFYPASDDYKQHINLKSGRDPQTGQYTPTTPAAASGDTTSSNTATITATQPADPQAGTSSLPTAVGQPGTVVPGTAPPVVGTSPPTLPVGADPNTLSVRAIPIQNLEQQLSTFQKQRDEALTKRENTKAVEAQTKMDNAQALLTSAKETFRTQTGITYDEYTRVQQGGRPAPSSRYSWLSYGTPSGSGSGFIPGGTGTAQRRTEAVTLNGKTIQLKEQGDGVVDSEGYTYIETLDSGSLGISGTFTPITGATNVKQKIEGSDGIFRVRQTGQGSHVLVIEPISSGATAKSATGAPTAYLFDTTEPSAGYIPVQADKVGEATKLIAGKRIESYAGELKAYSNDKTSPDVIISSADGTNRIQQFNQDGNLVTDNFYSADGKGVRTIRYKAEEITVNNEKSTRMIPSEILEQHQVGTQQVNGKTVPTYEYKEIIPERGADGLPTGKVTIYTKDANGNTKKVENGQMTTSISSYGSTNEVILANDAEITGLVEDKDALSSIQTQEKSRAIFQKVDFVLTEFSGFSGYSQLFLRKQLAPWRESVDEFFSKTYLGSEYWASNLCSKYSDDTGDNVAMFETPRGVVTPGAHIEAERSDPIQTLDPATNKFGTEYFYKITFAIQNTNKYRDERGKEEEMRFNIHLKGQRDIYLYNDSIQIEEGERFYRSGTSAVVQYSTYLYEEVCIEFEQPVRTLGGSYINELCNEITTSGVVPSGYTAPASSDTTSSGGAASGSVAETII